MVKDVLVKMERRGIVFVLGPEVALLCAAMLAVHPKSKLDGFAEINCVIGGRSLDVRQGRGRVEVEKKGGRGGPLAGSD
jgi:hypothetical protein